MDSLALEMSRSLTIHESQLRATDSSVVTLKRKNQLIIKTVSELKSSGKSSVWEAIGRTFVEIPLEKYEEKLKLELSDNLEDINNLNKKRHYLETSIDNTRESLSKLKLMSPN